MHWWYSLNQIWVYGETRDMVTWSSSYKKKSCTFTVRVAGHICDLNPPSPVDNGWYSNGEHWGRDGFHMISWLQIRIINLNQSCRWIPLPSITPIIRCSLNGSPRDLDPMSGIPASPWTDFRQDDLVSRPAMLGFLWFLVSGRRSQEKTYQKKHGYCFPIMQRLVKI